MAIGNNAKHGWYAEKQRVRQYCAIHSGSVRSESSGVALDRWPLSRALSHPDTGKLGKSSATSTRT